MKHKSLLGLGMMVMLPASFTVNGQTQEAAKTQTESQTQQQAPQQEAAKPSQGQQAAQKAQQAMQQKYSTEVVKQVQQALKEKGYKDVEADGHVGQKTKKALKEFQKAHSLKVTGDVDAETLSALGVSESGAPSSH